MITVQQIIDDYFTEQDKRGAVSTRRLRSVWLRCCGLVKYGRGSIGAAPAVRLDAQKLIKWFDALKAACAPTAADECRKILSAALHHAQRRGDLPLGVLPTAALTARHAAPRTGSIPLHLIPEVLTDLREQASVTAASADDTRRARLPVQALLLYIYTGARAEELRNIRLRDVVELDGVPCLQLHRTKNGLPHVLTLAPDALNIVRCIIDKHPHTVPDAYLLQPTSKAQRPISADTIARAWASVQARHGLSGLTLHDLRRTASAALATSGESVEAVDLYLNHQRLTAVQRAYYQPQPARLYAIACRLADVYAAPPTAPKMRCRSLIFGAAVCS